MPTRTLRPDRPIGLRRTLAPLRRGAGDPTFRVIDGEVWRATRTPDGAASMRIGRVGAGIEIEAWGRGASWVLEHAPDLVGMRDTADFAPQAGLLDRLNRRFPSLRMCRSLAVFEVVLLTILEQKVTGKASRESYRRLVWRFGEPAPGPQRLQVPPEPAVIAALPYEAFHGLNVERKRADTIRFAAHRATRLEEIVAMSRADGWARLTAFPGIGPWTAANAMQVALGDPDAVEVGDYHLPNIVAWNLAAEPRADDDRMLELLEPYAGHRARAARLLKLGGSSPPKFGPKNAVRSIRGI